MESENRWERVAEDSPLRCQGMIPSRGQCTNKQMEGSNFCPAHGGNRGNAQLEKEKARLFNLKKFQKRVNELEDSSVARTLTAELGVLRMLIEQRINSCNDDNDLMRHSQGLTVMLGQAERLVLAINKLELQNGQFLNANQAVTWATAIIEIISPYVEDEEDLQQISDAIANAYRVAKDGVSV